jgi:amino acid transporter
VLTGFVALIWVALEAGFGAGAMTLRPFYAQGRFEAGAIFSATSLCIMTFLGFDAISTLSEETKGNDRRMIGRAITSVLLISAAFFILLGWVFGNALPGIQIQDPASAYLELARVAIGPWATLVLAWAVVVVIGFSNALPMQVGVARVLFAMGRDRQLPAILARVHPKYRTPYVGMLAAGTISLAVAPGDAQTRGRACVRGQFWCAGGVPPASSIGARQVRHRRAFATVVFALARTGGGHRGGAGRVHRDEPARAGTGDLLAHRREPLRLHQSCTTVRSG